MGLLSALAALPVQAGTGVLRQPLSEQRLSECVVIDNDYDIDDMMAIPLVIANRRVAAIVQTEGYTLPSQAAPAANALINHSDLQSAQPTGTSPIPIIVGGVQAQAPDWQPWPWMPFFRAMMNRSNGLLAVEPKPWPHDPDYPHAVQRAVADCRRVSVLLTAPFTSFIHYAPLIRHKLDRVVITGRRLEVGSIQPAHGGFNCFYDLQSCKAALGQLTPDWSFFITLPDIPSCQGFAASQHHSCYTPSYGMVAGELDSHGRRSGGLLNQGLPGRLKRALINSIHCSSFYTAVQSRNRSCSSLSTWEPAAVASGPEDRVLLWDQSTALFLLDPGRFTVHVVDAQSAAGVQHYEPRLVGGSHAKTVKSLRSFWTAATNRRVSSVSPVLAHD